MTIKTQSPAWFALYTRHQHEKMVAQDLAGRWVESFLPLYKAAHRWKDRVKELSLPLFPNYVFVRARPDQRGLILSTPGVYDFVRLGGVPAPIPAEEIEAVRHVVEGGLYAEPHPFLKSGDQVRVKSGPLEGLEGILVRKKGFYRLVLSVELLVSSISVEVEVADVERVAEGRAWTLSEGASMTVPGGY
ncbi:MAG TPA: UpxY family transcription antiterminator [Terriglobia bacterium]|nr:UpxY family transcription antiterminator [Terriglobia bacterium]